MKHIVIFASGSGSNAENIIRYFKQNQAAEVVAVFTNKATAGVLEKASEHQVPTVVFSALELAEGIVLERVLAFRPDLIVLAGFLLKFPEKIIEAFPDKIINIHPALLPKFGGKGMYGMHVHRAVIDQRESETGITIHYVNANYDEGDIIFQASIPLDGNETCEEISGKVQQLEHKHFPEVISQILNLKS